MIPILLGKDATTGKRLYLKPDVFGTHLHLIGATGTGKTSAIHTLLRPLMLQSGPEKCALFVIDPMGNLARELLHFLAHPTLCTQHVRDRLVYIEPARDSSVMPFNPLRYHSEAERYYQTIRAVDLVLRAWDAQDVTQQPRLLQWTYKAFCAAAMLGYPIAICQFLLHPGTPEHAALLAQIPGQIRHHWQEIFRARGSEATRILESTRNRLDPFFESPNLRYMFGVAENRFDCDRLIRERRIVILNLGRYGRIPDFIGDTIGSLVLNEIFESASRLSTTHGRGAVEPTYILMDEFQKYVSADIESALPTVRQMGLRLMLAHQSFSQLESDTVDLTHMIWQARSRLIFANNANDADVVADELARLTFDRMKVKHQLTSRKQLIMGYRREWMESVSTTKTESTSRSDQTASATTQNDGQSWHSEADGYGYNRGSASNDSSTSGATSGSSEAESAGRSQTNVPIHKTIDEPSSVTFESFDEHYIEWGRSIRQLKTGEAFVQLANTDGVKRVKVHFDPIEATRESRDRVAALLERNFASDFFISSDTAKQTLEADRQRLIEQRPEEHQLPSEGSREPDSHDKSPSPFEL